MSMKCRLCGKGALEIRGYLKRMNEKGVEGIWECRPSCDADLSEEERVIAAIEDDNEEID
jgi:hypothetical protein